MCAAMQIALAFKNMNPDRLNITIPQFLDSYMIGYRSSNFIQYVIQYTTHKT